MKGQLTPEAAAFEAGFNAGKVEAKRGRAGDDVLTQAWTRYKISIAEPVRCPGCGRYDCYSLACKFNVED